MNIDRIKNKLLSGIQHYQKGELQEAEACYQEVLQYAPNNPDALHLLGLVANHRGEFQKAIDLIKKAIELKSGDPNFYNNLGSVYQDRQMFSEAIEYYQKAIELQSNFAPPHYNLGNIYQKQGNFDRALDCYQQAIKINPNYSEAYNKSGLVYRLLKQFQEAINCYHKAIELKPKFAEAYNNCGNIYLEQQNLDEARQNYQRAIQIQPNYAEAYNNLGNLYKEQQLFVEAVVCFERAICLRQSYAEAHANLGLTLLFLGEFDRGFAEYEWRFTTEKLNRFQPQNCMWDGKSDLEGKSIVLWNEQGLGDAIQFVRYAKLLQQKGTKVTLSVNSPLVRLFGECLEENFAVLDRQSCDLSVYDFHISLNSLPYIFKTTIDTIPNSIPYIKGPINSNLRLPISDCEGAETPPLQRIGIVWASKINTAIYQQKSCDVKLFIDFLSLENVSLYSLQVGADADRIQSWVDNDRVFDLNPLLNDFADTASVIAELDLIITVDTAVAHLAGAMGKPVWVLLPFVPDWRWQLERSDTPWYPTMRLFRQKNRGDWIEVFQQVKEELQDLLHGAGERGREREIDKQNIKNKQLPLTPTLSLWERETTNNQQQTTQVQSYYSDGYNYQQKGEFERAIRSYQQAIFLEPNHVSAYNNLGNIYRQQGRLDESKYCLEKAIFLDPKYSLAYSNIGNVCYEKGQLTEAAQYYHKAIELKPDLAEAYNNLASVSYQQGQLQSAVQYYQQAIELKPNYTDARTNLGVTLLLLGEFDRGFVEYEWRLKQTPSNRFQDLASMWDGSNIEGKSIVLWDEQGLGDTIQFVRYAYLVKDLGAKVILCVHSALVSLFQECLQSDFEIVSRDSNNVSNDDYHAPLMSLPGIFHTNLENIPNSIPYIKAPLDSNCRLPTADCRLPFYSIGIVWASKINTKLYRKKSCKPELFIDLLNVGDIALYSLQVGTDADKIKPWVDNSRVFDLSSILTDFVATASIIAQLDLVITIDTAVAHLAGAMGKPVWVLLPFVPDWRWQLETSDTPWYPTMRLFRQPSLDDWTGVFQQVKQELQENVGAQALRPGSVERDEKRKKKKKKKKDKQTTNNQQLIKQGIQHHERGELEQAEALYDRVLQQQPNHADAKHLLGAIAYQRGEYQKADRLVKEAIELNNTIPRFYNTLGNIYREQRQFDRSIGYFQKAIDLHSNYAEAYNNIGIVYQERGQFDLAKRSYQQALQLQPNNAEMHYNIALIFLLLGDFDRGFAEYEWRFDDKRLSHCKPKTPMWNCREIRGKSIVLWNEQGLGDCIQFVRYAKNLKDLGAKVILSVHPSLVSLFQECLEDKFEVIEQSKCDIYAWDYHISMMSLPGIFKTIPDTIPNSIPYIKAPLNSVLGATLTLTLSQKERGFAPLQMDFYRIGIVWASEPKNPMYRKKSCNLELFIDLLSLEKIALYSLQVGADAEKIQPWVDSDRVFHLSPLLTDFIDTASVIAQLDLVITVDTAVAHLAGAMGKQVWVLLPFVPDWRWQLETSDTPWYPTMRLFRQPNLDDWTGVFQQVKQELQENVGAQYLRPGSVEKEKHQQKTKNEQRPPQGEEVEREIINYNNLANSYQKQKMHPEAIECYQKVIELDPDNAKAYNNLGLVYYAQKQLPEALKCYQKALQLNPDYVKAYNNLGIIYYELGQFQQAQECYEKAIQLQPNNVKAYNNLGNIYKETEQFIAAIECYRKALSLQPNYPKAYSNMGVTYQEQRLFSEAMENLRKAIELEPNSAEAYYNLSVVYYELGQLTEAINYCQKALELQPNLGLAYCHRGLLFLSSGDFGRGLKDYEWRFEDKRLKRFQPQRPMWDGSDLKGKSIVLWNEQGLGDSIQFIRYVRQLQEMEAKVIISAHPSLVKLFRECLEYSVEVVESSKCNIYACDYHAAMMSLPYIFKTTRDTIPNSIPYIKAPTNNVIIKGEETSPLQRIGIVWASEKKNPMYRKKSCNPELFIDLLDVGNISLYSLQVGGDADKIQSWVDNDRVYDLSSLLTDFTDTASVIEQLDLVITIDTAVAHLAGAMGKLVWVLLPFVPDWRWQLEDRTTPWYPTMRLFRQSSLDDWTGVFEEVKRELQNLLKGAGERGRGGERERGRKGQINKAITNNEQQTTNNKQLIKLSFDSYFKGQSKEAENYCKQVLQTEPNNADILHLLGVILHQKGNNKIAIELIKQALSLKPKEHTFYNNLGTVYQEEDMFAEALQCYDRALEILPNDVLLINNIGNAYKKQGRFDEAKKCYDRAIELKPEFGSSHYNLGLLLLLLGDFERGLLEYEWRFEIEDLTRFKPKTPMWDGKEIKGRSIVLWNEQGLGDSIQFVRYAKQLKDRGAKVTISTHQSLISLFREGLEEEFEIIDRNACDVSNYDCHASLLSLPYILKTTPDTIPNSIPYIKAPIDSNCRLPIADCQLPSYRIGIVWASKNNTKIYRIKSFKPDLFIDLLDIGNIALYSLQVGKNAEEIKPWVDNDRIFDLSPLLNDFADTASVIEQLDLIITVDTAVAHLAGAMGKPVWVLLPFVPDWRWQLERSDTPWYPTMRLFRQPSLGDWQGVFKQVKQELQSLTPALSHYPHPAPLPQGEGVEREITKNQKPKTNNKQQTTNNKKKKGFSVTQTKNTAPSLPSTPKPITRHPLGIGWGMNLTTGWGNYGLNLVLQLLQMPDFAPVLLVASNISNDFNPLHREILLPLLNQQQKLQKLIEQHPGKQIALNSPVLYALNKRFQGNLPIKGDRSVGVIFLEDTHILPDAIARAKQFDLVIAGSTWNGEILKSYGLENVRVCLQGIDPAKFHPAPKSNLCQNRFVVFSGGKLEYRKGQDIVVAAFKRFVSRHPDALLVTAWHNFWPEFMQGIDRVGHVQGLPNLDQNKRLLVKEWLVANGIPGNACLDIGIIPNHLVGQVIREADVAVFTNRGEGGTNLVAMECLACGIPTILSANTGHLDLLGDKHCYPLSTQRPVKATSQFVGVEGWGESDVDEVVEALEKVYNDRLSAKKKGEAAALFMQDWTWNQQIRRFCNLLLENKIV